MALEVLLPNFGTWNRGALSVRAIPIESQGSNWRLANLRNLYTGRVVIVANGPSLNQMDLRFLRRETVIGVNKIYLGLERFGFYPRYYVAVNEKVLRQSVEPIMGLNCVKIIGERGAHLIPEDALTYHVKTRNISNRFCRDISEGLHEGWTVTYAALQLAYHLGFSEVVIIGMDHRYDYSGEPNEGRFMEGADPNHFSTEYFAGQDWDNPDLARSEESYRIARHAFESDNRAIIDATVGGSCEVFQRGDYCAIFNC